jgi:hypothetical protein
VVGNKESNRTARGRCVGLVVNALAFQTWHALARQQGFDEESVEPMVSMARCLTEG